MCGENDGKRVRCQTHKEKDCKETGGGAGSGDSEPAETPAPAPILRLVRPAQELRGHHGAPERRPLVRLPGGDGQPDREGRHWLRDGDL